MEIDEARLQAVAAPAATWAATAWTCSLCGQCNLLAESCEACGVARRFLDDPPLELPGTPGLADLPSFWIGVMWGVAALAGLLMLANPAVRATLGSTFLLLEVVGAGAAALSSLYTALWERTFNQVELLAPPHAASGTALVARLRLVPYATLDRVQVSVSLVDRFYRQSGRELELASQALDSQHLLENGRLPGRRATELAATFQAPFPVTPHSSVQAQLLADVLGIAAVVLPAARQTAANLREHGGYYLEARVRVGLLARSYHRRVMTYSVGDQIHFG